MDDLVIDEMTNILDLPYEIQDDIFTRLPAESVLDCKQVCKTWEKLLYKPDPYFLDMHLRRHQLSPVEHDDHYVTNYAAVATEVGGFVFLLLSNKKHGGYPLYYADYDENIIDEHFTFKRLRRINHALIKKRLHRSITCSLVGSSNGLICFSEPRGHGVADPVHICNPITRECVNLPRLGFNDPNYVIRNLCGFGYDSTNNVYKVVRIYTTEDGPINIGQIQVYTLGGSDGWRDAGEIANLDSPRGIFSNNALHWLDTIEKKIVAFDLTEETFYEIDPIPPCLLSPGHYTFFKLKMLGRWLSVVHQNHLDKTLDIWMLKVTKKDTFTDDEDERELAWNWIKELSIPRESLSRNRYDPFALTKSGEFLFLCNDTTLSLYDRETATFKQFAHVEFAEAIPHTNSFVSLKALGENCKKRKYKVRP